MNCFYCVKKIIFISIFEVINGLIYLLVFHHLIIKNFVFSNIFFDIIIILDFAVLLLTERMNIEPKL